MIRSFAAVCIMASMLAGCGAAASASETSAGTESGENHGGEDGVFTIAYAPNESTTESADARKGLADDLSKELGC